MSACVYGVEHWYGARQRRAQTGRAPSLAVQRSIHLRQFPSGRWGAAISERRFGNWAPPQFLCSAGSFAQARAAALVAWRKHRLPLLWSYADDRGMRPFHVGLRELRAVAA